MDAFLWTFFRRAAASRGFMALVLSSILCLCQPLAAGAAETYRLNPGDKLEITVWQEENLHAEVVVLPDGTISFPLIGHVPAAGTTTEELTELLGKRLSEFVSDPEVDVRLKAADGNMVYVTGEVEHPGAFVMTRPTDVMQALSMAGGLTAFAKRNGITILRRRADGHSQSLPFAYDDVEDGQELELNILLQSGDTIIVP
jgi:polysaccharide export outer membrane protein